MLDKGQQIRNSIIYMVPQGLSSLLPFITIPIFTRILSPEDYGIFAIGMIYATFICGLANFGVSLAFERNYFKYRVNLKKLAELVYSSLVFVMINFTVLAVITYLFKDNISIFLTGSTQHGTLIITACMAQFFFHTINNFFFIFFKNEGDAKSHTKYRILSTILYFIISLFLVAYMRVGIIGLVIAHVIPGVALFIILFYLFLTKFHFSLNITILLELLKICYPLTPRLFLGIFSSNVDKYMISLLATISGVGVYHIGKRVTDLVFSLTSTLQNVFGPQVYQRMFNEKNQGNGTIGRYLTPFFYISTFVSFIVVLSSEELLTILTPVSYHGAIPIIIILAMFINLLFFEKIMGIQLVYAKKTGILSILSILGMVLGIILNIPMIMKFGAIGAAYATLIGTIIVVSFNMKIAQRYYKINWEWKKLSWIIGTFFIGSFSTLFLYFLDAPYLLSLSIRMAFMAVFLYFGVRYRILTKENFLIVRDAFFLRKLSPV